jgi:nitrate reductase gamma subunit
MIKLVEVATPIVTMFADWVSQNSDLFSNLVITAGAISGFVAAIGTIGLIVPKIIT